MTTNGAATMTPEAANALRASFTPDQIEHLPRVWCKACRDSRDKHCDRHQAIRCDKCHTAKITSAHVDLSYVGHAEVTDRLLQVDPTWTWEPMAFDPQTGLPMLDRDGGLWMRLTVCGVTRIGYGDAEGKNGASATKERIGDAIRNAAMRFGVGVELWGASGHVEAEATRREEAEGQFPPAPATNGNGQRPSSGNGQGNGQPEETPEQRLTRYVGKLLFSATQEQVDWWINKLVEFEFEASDVSRLVSPDAREALGIGGEALTGAALISHVRSYAERHHSGPANIPEGSGEPRRETAAAPT